MSSPKIIVQIAIAGAQILGRAFLAAGRQAALNAKQRPEGLSGGDVTGIRGATSGSPTDRLTLQHRMTLDEAQLILNVKREEPIENVLQRYQHMFKANSPPPPPAKPAAGKKAVPPAYSHYLQSKVVRALERIEAENKMAEAEPPSSPPPSESTTPPDGGKSS